MHKLVIRAADYRGRIQKCVVEDCANPKCGTNNLRYPVAFVGPACPNCKWKVLGGFFKTLTYFDRRMYHLGSVNAQVNRTARGEA